jgi:hypothetical protein
MPTSPLLINPNNPNLMAEVDTLVPVPGYCIFIDIVGSTLMKQRGIREWTGLIHNGFANARTFLDAFRPLKGIGDELMYYIEEADLVSSGYSAMQVFDGLYQIANESNTSFPATKIVAAYCTSVYAMTFLPGAHDYYGIDIDRAARLKGGCISPSIREKEVIIDDQMYDRVRACYDKAGNQSQFASVLQLRGPTSHTAKGIPNAIPIYRTIET